MATAAQIAQWVTRIGTIAKEQAKRHYQTTGRTIFPSVCIAQSCIESAWGTAPKMINANAVFGIKVGSGKKWGGAWKGKTYKTGTVEYYDGKNATRISDSFRAYDTIEESVEDYYDILTKSERYHNAWDVTTPRACIEGIQKAPYATDPDYVRKVMSIIEKYGLTVYDNDILKSSQPIAPPKEAGSVSQTVMIGHASIDERGKIASGQAGDQTGKEVCTRSWYNKNWSVLLRPKNSSLAEQSAQACEKACANNNIGYDQNQRNTCYTQAKKVGYDISRIATPCETDCSALMTLCAIAGGARSLEYTGNAPTTRTMVNAFVLTGLYDNFTDSKYLTSPDYLRRGDILVQPGSHTVMVLTNGSKSGIIQTPPVVKAPTYASKQKLEYTSDGKLILETLPSGVHVVSEVNGIYKLGDKGPEVKLIQSKLQSLGYRVDVDGYYDVMTATAVKQFQTAKHLEADGECGPQTAFALQI